MWEVENKIIKMTLRLWGGKSKPSIHFFRDPCELKIF